MTDDPWWWPLREAFKKHLDESHQEKWFENQDELAMWLEEAHYGEFKDGEDHEWPCCWWGCKWTIKFETSITMKLNQEEEE